MEKLYALARNVQKLTDTYVAVQAFTKETVKKYIIKLNTEGQLFDKGEDSLGTLLPLYSGSTRGKPAGTPYTLKDTGEFYESFNVTVDRSGNFEINANTIKSDVDQIIDLEDIASPYIIGLSDESKEKLSTFIVPVIQEITRRTLLGL